MEIAKLVANIPLFEDLPEEQHRDLATIALHRLGAQHLASGLPLHPANRVGQRAAVALGLGLAGRWLLGSRRLWLGLGLGPSLGLRPNATRADQEHGEQQQSKRTQEAEHVPIYRRVRQARTFALDLRNGGNQTIIVMEGVAACWC